VREFKKANALIIFPLIPAFSLREKVQEPFATPSKGEGAFKTLSSGRGV